MEHHLEILVFLNLVPKITPTIEAAIHLGPFEARVSWKQIDTLHWQDSRIEYVIKYQKYHVKGDTSSAKEKVVGSSESSVELNELRQNTTYIVFVSARNSVGTSKSDGKIFSTNSRKYFSDDKNEAGPFQNVLNLHR